MESARRAAVRRAQARIRVEEVAGAARVLLAAVVAIPVGPEEGGPEERGPLILDQGAVAIPGVSIQGVAREALIPAAREGAIISVEARGFPPALRSGRAWEPADIHKEGARQSRIATPLSVSRR